MEKKICPECGKEFECSHSENCWCTKYTLTEESANALRIKYEDCLCEDCFRKIAKNN